MMPDLNEKLNAYVADGSPIEHGTGWGCLGLAWYVFLLSLIPAIPCAAIWWMWNNMIAVSR
jgi:hypothetical protein